MFRKENGKHIAVKQLWFHPPQPPTVFNQPPASPDLFFARSFFYWAPYKLFKVRLHCPDPACNKHKLTACGFYKTVRRVLDIDGYFYMGCEYLECTGCTKKLPAWSYVLLQQLDVGHRVLFPAILTYRYVC